MCGYGGPWGEPEPSIRQVHGLGTLGNTLRRDLDGLMAKVGASCRAKVYNFFTLTVRREQFP